MSIAATTTTSHRRLFRHLTATLVAAIVAGLVLLSPPAATAASSTTGDLTVCAQGAFTRNVPIQLRRWNGSSWQQVIRTGTTGTGCGVWRDVPAKVWLAVTVKTTTYGGYQTCGMFPGSWFQISGGTGSFYVNPYQSAQVNLTVNRYNFC